MPNAEAAFNKLQAEVLITPDLTEADRLVALALYQKKWTQTREGLTPRAGAARSRGARPLREGEEIERRANTEATQVAAILANKLQTPAADANPGGDLDRQDARARPSLRRHAL